MRVFDIFIAFILSVFLLFRLFILVISAELSDRDVAEQWGGRR